jgi:copper resistance protein B
VKHYPCITTTFATTAVCLLGLFGFSIPATAQTTNFPSMNERVDAETQSPPGTVGKNWPKPVEDSQWFGSLLVDELEYQMWKGDDTVRWDTTGCYGGDYNRLWLKSEGGWRTSGERGGEAQVQALYGRLIAPFWDFQVGLRYDQFSGAGFDRSRGFAVIGVEGLAPGWFELETALFISRDGDVSANLTATHDLLLTQRLILQPRVDFDAAVQSAEKFGVGEGVNSIGLGLRLRYEITREFAPYIGVQWLNRFGETADLARRDGGRSEDIAVVFGVRLWF